jgi:hypothetical protein
VKNAPAYVDFKTHSKSLEGSIVVANEKSASPTWIDVKAGLQTFDRAGLLGLLQDLYAGSKDNQAYCMPV